MSKIDYNYPIFTFTYYNISRSKVETISKQIREVGLKNVFIIPGDKTEMKLLWSPEGNYPQDDETTNTIKSFMDSLQELDSGTYKQVMRDVNLKKLDTEV